MILLDENKPSINIGPLGDSCETACCVWQSVSNAKILNGLLLYLETMFSSETNEKVPRIELNFPNLGMKHALYMLYTQTESWVTNIVTVTS